MSFFIDFFNEFNVDDNDVKIYFVLGKILYLSGNFKILDFNDFFVYLLIGKLKYKIWGTSLKIKSIAKNEIIVQGNIVGFVEEDGDGKKD